MLRRVVIPPFGRPPAEYDPQYLADVTRAYSVLMELLMQRGEGQFSKVFLANLVSSPTSTLEAHEVFERGGTLMVANNDGSLPAGGVVPTGGTADRPGTPVQGQLFYNTDLTRFEGYNGTSWVALS